MTADALAVIASLERRLADALEYARQQQAEREKTEQKLSACTGAMRESLKASGYSPGNEHPAENVLAATLKAVDFSGEVGAAFGGVP